MIKGDYHIHTTFSDGKNTAEEMVLRAIELGLDEIGFSDHSYISEPADSFYWMHEADEQPYRAEITRLKEKYKDKIRVLLGIEQDYYSDNPAEGYDYIIGSVHFVKTKDGFFDVDYSADYFRDKLKYFGGDPYRFAEEYYKLVTDVVRKTGADIIGHFDLVTKHNDVGHLFDENHPRYIKAWQAAADELLKTGKPFEINMGAIMRGLKTHPYPAAPIIEYIKKRGGRFILSSDAHSAQFICNQFDKYEYLADLKSLPY